MQVLSANTDTSLITLESFLYEVDTSLAGLTHSIEYIFLTNRTVYI